MNNSKINYKINYNFNKVQLQKTIIFISLTEAKYLYEILMHKEFQKNIKLLMKDNDNSIKNKLNYIIKCDINLELVKKLRIILQENNHYNPFHLDVYTDRLKILIKTLNTIKNDNININEFSVRFGKYCVKVEIPLVKQNQYYFNNYISENNIEIKLHKIEEPYNLYKGHSDNIDNIINKLLNIQGKNVLLYNYLLNPKHFFICYNKFIIIYKHINDDLNRYLYIYYYNNKGILVPLLNLKKSNLVDNILPINLFLPNNFLNYINLELGIELYSKDSIVINNEAEIKEIQMKLIQKMVCLYDIVQNLSIETMENHKKELYELIELINNYTDKDMVEFMDFEEDKYSLLYNIFNNKTVNEDVLKKVFNLN
jgi:hypothetical protein